MPSKIYLASPYSSPMDPRWTEKQKEIQMGMRYSETVKAAVYLINKGYVVYSPIVSWHPVAKKHELPRDYRFWERMDEAFIRWCDALFVLKLKDWTGSNGVTKEVKLAKQLGRKIGFMEYSRITVDYTIQLQEEEDVP